MKTGCALSLIFLVAGYFAGSYLIQHTEIEDQYWLPFVYGIGVMLVCLNAWGILQALQKKLAAGKQASDWKTGDLVVLSGTIRAKRTALIAPFSKQQAVMVEYSIKPGGQNENDGMPSQYFGFLMTPCTIRSAQGTHSLLGFQILPDFSKQILFHQTAFPNAIEFVRQTSFKPIAGSPIEVATQLIEILGDADGDVDAHYAAPDGRFLETMLAQQGDKLKGLDPFRGFTLEEKLIANGAEVTVSGTFHAETNSIDIGNPMKNLTHSIALGTAEATSIRPIVVAIIYTLVFGLALGGATYFLLTFPKR